MPTLRKYSEAYRMLYPSSAQLIVKADPLRFWKPRSLREHAVKPVVDSLQGILTKTREGSTPRILLHLMSNGGACSLVDLASAVRKRGIEAPQATKCAIVFDSSPAPVNLIIMNRAFTAGIRNHLLRYLTMSILSLIYVGTWLIGTLFRLSKPMQRELAELNNPSLLPWTSTRTPRLYLYSFEDKVVPAARVEEHAAKARMAGFSVQMVHFGQSAHVSHARNNPEKYWTAVRTFWEEACQ
ncbi:hypothetical protein BD414DRAFT_172248 [Trametes punicea]|nr:hypothetical protein BD414DRAFT_172248 [Trametes punicea]